MNQGVVHYAIWIACTVLQGVLIWLMVRKGLRQEFPIFFWYTVAHLMESIGSFAASVTSEWGYFIIYWGWEALDAVLTLLILQAIFIKVFDSYPALRGIGLTIFRWATICLCLIAVLSAVYVPGTSLYRMMNGVLVMDRSIQMVEVGLLLCLFFSSRLLGLPWRHYVYGIILGFGVCASISLVSAALRTQLGARYNRTNGYILGSAYLVELVIWTYYFSAAKSVEVSSKPPSSTHLYDWNEALAGILHK